MTKKFAVNIIGYVEDKTDKYNAEQIERMLSLEAVTHCFEPLKTVAVIAKELPENSTEIDVKKVKKRYKFTH